MRYYFRKSEGCAQPNGSILYRTPGPFASVAAVGNCPCADGQRRMVYATGEPDTFFSIPAATRVRGKWVSGFLTTADTLKSAEGYEFVHYTYGKNAALMQEWRGADERTSADFVRRFCSWERTPAQWLRSRFPADFREG